MKTKPIVTAAAIAALTLTSMPRPAAAAETCPATTAINQLGLDLHRLLAADAGNLCLSPYSIQGALAMTWAGAAGDTMEQMRDVLHFGDDEEALHMAFLGLRQRLDGALERAVERAGGDEDATPAWLVANRLFPTADLPLQADYVERLERWHGAEPELLDYRHAPEQARLRINHWVEEQTRERIKDLLPQGAINEDTRLVLANAVYLKTPWSAAFNKAGDRAFHAPEGELQVPFMRRTGRFGHHEGEGYVRVTIPYRLDPLQFVIWMPTGDQDLEGLEERMTADWLAAATDRDMTQLDLQLPMFKIEEAAVSLKDALQGLGLTLPFDRQLADFRRMESSRSLMVTDVVHKAFIAVDEQGTEAAAATAAVIGLRSVAVPTEPLRVTIDRPFVYAIQDRESGALLFLGRVVNP